MKLTALLLVASTAITATLSAHEYDFYRPGRTVIIERHVTVVPAQPAPLPPIPWAQKSKHKGFVISPYSGQELDVRGVKAGTLCFDPTSYGRQYLCP